MIAAHLADLAAIAAAEPCAGAEGVLVRGISTDTRRIAPGELFVALDGPSFRGSDHIAAAARRGAVAALAPRAGDAPAGFPLLLVDDTHRALAALAISQRERLDALVVGITGSVGKTTTKDALATLLGAAMPTVAAPASFNNRVGVPLTILAADETTRALVLEIGASLLGEVRALGGIARPDHVVVTAVAESHLEGFRDLETVTREKLSLIESLRPGGTAFVNADDERLDAAAPREALRFGFSARADFRAVDPVADDRGIGFRLARGGVPIRAPLFGRHNLTNLLAAVAVARLAGMDDDAIAAAALRVRAPAMRMQRLVRDGVLFVLDCYNANPASMRAAVAAFGDLAVSCGRRIGVFGDMGELGEASERLHAQLGRELEGAGLDLLVFVGPRMAAAHARHRPGAGRALHAADLAAAREILAGELAVNDAVLVKGSRAMALEGLLDPVRENVA